MRWFGRSKNDKKQPLIQELNTIAKDDGTASPEEARPAVTQGAGSEARASAPTPDGSLPVERVVSELDANIPAKRVTSGEREMILPKHMKLKIEQEEDALISDNNENPSYLPFVEVNTQSQDDSHSTAVISAISLSTIGASIEREVEVAKNMKSAPPLEIKATKQEVKKKVEERFPFIQHFPDRIVDNLAGAYDYLHKKPKQKTIDDVPVTARKYRRDHPDLLLPGNVPQVGFTACLAAIPLWVKFLAVGAVAAAALAGLTTQLKETMLGEHYFDWQEENFVDWSEEKSLAFIGNSYMFVNDVPRLMQKISRGKIHQNSCINPSASLGKLLRAGNGMYEVWQTDNSITYKYDTEWSGQDEVYDYGMCSVFQLLEGYDNDLTYMNYNGAYYYEADSNPCFEDENYILYLNDRSLKYPEIYDYVLINDQTARMADPDAREDSIDALKYAYAPMIADSRARPLIVDTHAYPQEPGVNETEYGENIPYMQAMIYYGVEEYLLALKYNLPSYLEPKVVPIGMAYTVVWDEDFELWSKLFLNETMPYASPHGSFLFANVIYATVYGHLPLRPSDQREIKNLFSSARYRPELPDDYSEIFPTMQEADYLRLVARRVVLQGYVPQVFTDARQQIEWELRYVEPDECLCNVTNSTDESASDSQDGEDEADEEREEERESEDCVCGEEEEEGSQDAEMDENEYRRFLQTFM